MRILIDTNRYCDFAVGEVTDLQVLYNAETIFISIITVGELRAGFLHGARAQQNESLLQAFLSVGKVEVLELDLGTTTHYSLIYRQLRFKGKPIPTNDLWIAALAMQHDLSLYTRDSHFFHIDGLQLCEI